MVLDILRDVVSGKQGFTEGVCTLVVMLAALLISLSAHELCHGLGALVMGDKTPRYDGRLSLNPLHHIDPIGTVCLLFFGFGWAKPVMVNPRNFKNAKIGMAVTALFGPLCNWILGFVAMLGYGYFQIYHPELIYMVAFFKMLLSFNIGLMIFNLIPIPPLDGSKVLGAILPRKWYYQMMRFERYGFIVLIVLINLPIFDRVLDWAWNLVFSGYFSIASMILF